MVHFSCINATVEPTEHHDYLTYKKDPNCAQDCMSEAEFLEEASK